MRLQLWLALGMLFVLWWGGVLGASELPLPELRVLHREGQAFATWTEVGGPAVTYNFYRSSAPITTGAFEQAELVATGIPQGTAHDFIADNVARRAAKKPPPEPQNFPVIYKEGPLPAGTGLFVYTPNRNRNSFYALTAVWPEGGEDRRLRIGVNSQLESIPEGIRTPAAILSVREEEGDVVRLDYLHWATPEQASVDGHPYKFRLIVKADEQKAKGLGLIVRLHPLTGNYTQARRAHPGFFFLALDDFTPAIGRPPHHHTGWSGYRESVGRSYLTGEYAKRAGGACLWAGKPADAAPVRDYTQQRILWTTTSVIRQFRVDKNRVYLTGSSMGGGGTVRFGFRHPGLFATMDANVPPLRGAADSVRTAKVDLPLLKFFNARQDKAIGWGREPGFVRALEAARQPFVFAWDNGGHGTPRTDVPESFKSFPIRQIRLDECVPALSNASTADDPGSGDPAEGDLVGAINDDFRWSVEKDTKDELVLRLWRIRKSGKFADVKEATVDVTPRRRQAFRPPPGFKVTFNNLSADDGSLLQEEVLTVEPSGLLTARKVRISLDPGSRLVFTTAQGAN